MGRLTNDEIKQLFFNTNKILVDPTTTINDLTEKNETKNGDQILLNMYSKYLNRPQIIFNPVTDETFNSLFLTKIEKNNKLQDLKSNFITTYMDLNKNIVIDEKTIMDDDMETHLNNILISIDKTFTTIKIEKDNLFDTILNTISVHTSDCSEIPTLEKFNNEITKIDLSGGGSIVNGGRRNQKTIEAFANGLPLLYHEGFRSKMKLV